MAITIKDVALKAGVARSTVSKVINDDPSISTATKARVRAVMAELNYTPNRLAQSLARQKSYTLGVLMTLEEFAAYKNPHVFEILCGIEKAAGGKHYNVALHNTLAIDAKLNQLQRLISEKRVDGFILHARADMEAVAKLLAERAIPYIILGKPPFNGPHSWVDIDNKAAAYLATKALLERDYQKLAFLAGPQDDGISQQRYRGFEQALLEHKRVANAVHWATEKTLACGLASWHQHLATCGCDAVLAVDSLLAAGVIQGASSNNIAIPAQLGVLAFDDHPICEVTQPSLSVMDLGLYQLGQEAATLLIEQIEHNGVACQKQYLSGQILCRQSMR